MRKLPSGEQPDNKAMKHQKGNFFIHVKLWKRCRKSTCCFKKWKPFLVEGIQICVQINNFCLKSFDFTLPRTLRNTVLRETTRILQNCALRWLLFCPMHWLAINKGTAVCLCIVINWQPSQTYSAALQSCDQPLETNAVTLSGHVGVFRLQCATDHRISWHSSPYLGDKYLVNSRRHGTWLLHFRNSSESIRKNHDCNRDRHTR